MPKTTTKVYTVKPWQWIAADVPEGGGLIELHPTPKRRGELRVAVVAEKHVRHWLMPKLTCNSPPKANN